MKINKELKIPKININPEWLKAIFSRYLTRYSSIIFIVILLMVFSVCVYYFYWVIYEYQWTVEKKQQYMLLNGRLVKLKQEEFNKIIEEIENRKKAFDSNYEVSKNIFNIKK